jgi:hypothetical protein
VGGENYSELDNAGTNSNLSGLGGSTHLSNKRSFRQACALPMVSARRNWATSTGSRVVRVLGIERAQAFFEQTLEVEAAGGMMLRWQPARTLGGVFFSWFVTTRRKTSAGRSFPGAHGRQASSDGRRRLVPTDATQCRGNHRHSQYNRRGTYCGKSRLLAVRAHYSEAGYVMTA